MAMNKQRRTSNINNIVTYDTLGNVTIPASFTVKGLMTAGLARVDANGLFSVDTTVYQAALPSQAGNSGKYLTTNGSTLSWGTVSTANIYTDNGTLTAARTLSEGGFPLIFTGGDNDVNIGERNLILKTSNNSRQSTYLQLDNTFTTTGKKFNLRSTAAGSFDLYDATSDQVRFKIVSDGVVYIGNGTQSYGASFVVGNPQTGGGIASGPISIQNYIDFTASRGLELQYDNSLTTSFIQSYNRSTSTWLNMKLRYNLLDFVSNGTQAMRLTSAGRLLLGTTTESTNILEVNGNTRIKGDLIFTNDVGNSSAKLYSSSVNGLLIFAGTGSTNNLYIGTSGGTAKIRLTNTDELLIEQCKIATIEIGGSNIAIPSLALNNTFGLRISGSSSGSVGHVSLLPSNSTSGLFVDASARIKIGAFNSTYSNSAILEAVSTTQGFLSPRMTSTQRDAIATPATGLQVYNTTGNTLDYYNGTAWSALASGNIYTADGTLTGNRTLDMSTFVLNFSNRINFSTNPSGANDVPLLEIGSTTAVGGRNQFGQLKLSRSLSPSSSVTINPFNADNLFIGSDPANILIGSVGARIGGSSDLGNSALLQVQKTGVNVVQFNATNVMRFLLVSTAASGKVWNLTSDNTGDFILGQTYGAITNSFRIFGATNNIGINTGTDAGFKLDVQGTARVSGQMSVNGFTISSPASGTLKIGSNPNTTGTNVTAFGDGAITTNGYVNSAAFGQAALGIGGTGNGNRVSGFGWYSGYSNSGSFNTYLGAFSGWNQTTGENNVIIGDSAGTKISGGSTNLTITNNSIFIGQNTKALADNQTNQIVIGYQETGLGSNTTIIGNSSTLTTAVRGRLILGTTSDSGLYQLDVTGDTRVSGVTTLTKTQTGLTGANDFVGTSIVSAPTTNASISWTASKGFFNYQGIFSPTFGGNITFQNSNYTGQELKINRITFAAASSTVTSVQGSGSNVRAFSNAILHNYIDGTNSGTITHFATLAMYGDFASSSARFTFTNRYGLLINDFQEYGQGHTYTNRWAIYQVGANDNNYFKGKVVIGSTDTVGASPLNVKNLPTSATGLSTGDIWSNGGVLTVV